MSQQMDTALFSDDELYQILKEVERTNRLPALDPIRCTALVGALRYVGAAGRADVRTVFDYAAQQNNLGQAEWHVFEPGYVFMSTYDTLQRLTQRVAVLEQRGDS
jgi:hypothetical protein